MKQIAEESGWLPVNKPEGVESFGVVRELKYRFKFKKIGFAGTLDPLATGVLLIAINKATKLIPQMHLRRKKYEVIVFFGANTKSQDMEGRYSNYQNIHHREDQRIDKLKDLIGSYEQKIPIFSAHKIKGKNFYEFARKGELIEKKFKNVDVSSLKIINQTKQSVKIEIECSTGFYVRSFAEELSNLLGDIGYAMAIKRLEIGDFTVSECIDLQNILDFSSINDLYSKIIPIYSGRHPG